MSKVMSMKYLVYTILSLLAACASTPAARQMQMEGWVKIAAMAALEENKLSQAELESVATVLDGLADQGQVGPNAVSALVQEKLHLSGYKALALQGALLQLDVFLADHPVPLDTSQYAGALKGTATAIRSVIAK